jgi:type IV pilus assembly protein PilA
MKHLNLKNTAAKGFSLVEMLVVIAVIGVIAAIAIPSIGSINSSAKIATAQRNAQSIVSMYQAGEAAGIDWVTDHAVTDAASAVTAVVTGASPSDGAFLGKSFRVPNLGTSEQSDVLPYLSWDATAKDLYYNKGS